MEEMIIGILLCVNGFLIYQVFHLGTEIRSWNAGKIYYARKVHDLQMGLAELEKKQGNRKVRKKRCSWRSTPGR